MSKIVLGTAQFGMDYGINNKRGKIPRAEVSEILRKALNSGIDTFDTAYSYGDSETILGKFTCSCREELKIISKLPSCGYGEVDAIFKSSLGRLKSLYLYGYLLHSFDAYKKDYRVWIKLEKLKQKRLVNNIGFSIYYPYELDSIIKDDLDVNIIQIPFSVFDQRFKIYLPELKKRKIEIYARSIFLQGLVFKKPIELRSCFDGIKDKLEQLSIISRDFNIPIFVLCLNFIIKNELINKVIIGVDNIKHFNELLEAPTYLGSFDDRIISRLFSLSISDERIVIPTNWKTEGVHV